MGGAGRGGVGSGEDEGFCLGLLQFQYTAKDGTKDTQKGPNPHENMAWILLGGVWNPNKAGLGAHDGDVETQSHAPGLFV